MVDEKTIKDFYIRLYFGEGKNYLRLAIQRAYRDFNRTLINLPEDENERNTLKGILTEIIEIAVNELLSKQYSNQEEFTLWHQRTSFQLVKASNKIFKAGQTQKWINMTLKYLYTFGEAYVPGISKNYMYFHVPIDNIIQDELYNTYGVPKLDTAWSKVEHYDTYHQYQIAVRDAIGDQIPMDVEFALFNTAKKEN